MATAPLRRLVFLLAGVFVLADTAGASQSAPGGLKDIPLRDGGPAPPLSCRDTVDPALAREVEAAMGDVWIKGKSWEAVGILEKALARDPYLQGAYRSLGTWYWALEPPKALALLNNGIERCPQAVMLYFDRANVYTKLGNSKAALEDLERSRTLGHDSDSLHFNIGNAYSKLKQFRVAASKYEEALVRDPRHTSAWRNLVIANAEAGNSAAALGTIDRLLGAFPSGELRQWALSVRPQIEKRGQ
jgi:tetratricopeptide (TPR) repeat protein